MDPAATAAGAADDVNLYGVVNTLNDGAGSTTDVRVVAYNIVLCAAPCLRPIVAVEDLKTDDLVRTADTRGEIYSLFPELEHNKASYGAPARATLTAHEATLLNL